MAGCSPALAARGGLSPSVQPDSPVINSSLAAQPRTVCLSSMAGAGFLCPFGQGRQVGAGTHPPHALPCAGAQALQSLCCGPGRGAEAARGHGAAGVSTMPPAGSKGPCPCTESPQPLTRPGSTGSLGKVGGTQPWVSPPLMLQVLSQRCKELAPAPRQPQSSLGARHCSPAVTARL